MTLVYFFWAFSFLTNRTNFICFMQMGQGFPVSIQSLSKAVDYYSKVHLKWSGPSTITALKLVGFCQEIIWYRKADLVSHAFRSRDFFLIEIILLVGIILNFYKPNSFIRSVALDGITGKFCNDGLEWNLALELVIGEKMEQALARL